MIFIKARNKIIAGDYREYKFHLKYGKLYIRCLENKISINEMTLRTITELERWEVPSLSSMLVRGWFLSTIFGWLGIIAGTSTAKRKNIYKMQIEFVNGYIGIAEIDDKIYEALLDIMVNARDLIY